MIVFPLSKREERIVTWSGRIILLLSLAGVIGCLLV